MERIEEVVKSSVEIRKTHRGYEFTKRAIDFFGAIIGLTLLSPIILLVAIAIKLESKGPIIFVQTRVGINGKCFKMYKFRSMIENAEELKSKLIEKNEMSGPMFKIKNDPRITKIGKFIRKTSIDELPQLINVLQGDLSLVGPRPIVEKEISKYGHYADKFFSVIPGVTGYWQCHGRSDTSYKERIEMDMYYIDNKSILFDIKIMFKTIISVIKKEGAV